MQWDALVHGEVSERGFGRRRREIVQDGSPERVFLRRGDRVDEERPGRRGKAAAREEHHGLIDHPALWGAVEELLLGLIGVVDAQLSGDGFDECLRERVKP